MAIILISFLLIWLICLALHMFAEYLDYEQPAKQEARYKKQVEKKYGTELMKDSRKMIGLESMNKNILERKAKAYAQSITALLDYNNNMPKYRKEELLEYYKNCYIEKHKNLI